MTRTPASNPSSDPLKVRLVTVYFPIRVDLSGPLRTLLHLDSSTNLPSIPYLSYILSGMEAYSTYLSYPHCSSSRSECPSWWRVFSDTYLITALASKQALASKGNLRSFFSASSFILLFPSPFSCSFPLLPLASQIVKWLLPIPDTRTR